VNKKKERRKDVREENPRTVEIEKNHKKKNANWQAGRRSRDWKGKETKRGK